MIIRAMFIFVYWPAIYKKIWDRYIPHKVMARKKATSPFGGITN